MRRAAGLVVLGALAALGVVALADATQSRPDARRAVDGTTQVTFAVHARRYPPGADAGQALWAACQGTFAGRTVGFARTGDGHYRAVVQPSLGQLARRRLVGCLEDATVDRVRGQVTAVTPVNAAL